MHKGLISQKEREMLQKFLTNQPTPKNFKVLKMLIKKYYPNISQDFILLKKSFEKFQETHN
jgi:hypothetical protein